MTRVLFVVLLSGALQAAAQTYPGKTVRIVVPFPAGGSTDVLARMSAEHLNKTHGQLFIVDNRPGATGTIASALVANSAPDGYTLLMHSVSTYIAGYMYKKVSYDPAKAFAPIVNLSVNPFILVSSASLPVKSVKELVALARSRPGDLTFGTVGMGSGAHLVAEMFNSAARIKTVSVHYKGSAPCMVALASGEVGFSVNNILDTRTFVNQGKLRALAVTGSKPSPAMPDVPTLIDAGIQVEANLWTGLFAPAATPKPIVEQLNQELMRIFDTREMREWLLNSLGGELPANTPEQFATFLSTETSRWQATVRQLAIQLD